MSTSKTTFFYYIFGEFWMSEHQTVIVYNLSYIHTPTHAGFFHINNNCHGKSPFPTAKCAINFRIYAFFYKQNPDKMWVNNDSSFTSMHSTDSSEILCEYMNLQRVLNLKH